MLLQDKFFFSCEAFFFGKTRGLPLHLRSTFDCGYGSACYVGVKVSLLESEDRLVMLQSTVLALFHALLETDLSI